MTSMPCSTLRALLGLLCCLLMHSLPGQERTAEAASKPAELLAMLDQPYTDWIAFQEVGERIERLGAAARPSLEEALAAATQRRDRRYQLRLLAIGARLDPALLAQLGGMVADADSRLAALAARLLVWCVRNLGHSARPFLPLAALLRLGRSTNMPAAQRLASARTDSRIMPHLSDAPH